MCIKKFLFKYLVLFMVLLFIFTIPVHINAQIINPYIKLDISNGEIVGDNLYIESIGGEQFIKNKQDCYSSKYGQIVDIPVENTYDLWVKAKGSGSFNFAIYDEKDFCYLIKL